MAANAPEVVVLVDDDHQTIIKIVGYYTALTSSNTKIQANTFRGANTSITPCLMSFTHVNYTTSMANGSVGLEFVGGAANTRAFTIGRFNDGEFNRVITNNSTGPTGDLNIIVNNAAANDSYTLLCTLLKEYTQGLGAGAWSNNQIYN